MTDNNPSTLAESLSEDFALSDSSMGQGLITDLPSDIDEPTVEEIEEWAKVDSPAAVRSVPSSHSDKDINEPSDLHGSDNESDPQPPSEAVLQEAADVAAQLSSPAPAPEDEANPIASKEKEPVNKPKVKSMESSPQQQMRQQSYGANDAAGSGAWGWSSGWGWDKLRQAAAEAVRDVSELKESFQQVLSDVVAADSEDEAESPPKPHRSPSPAKPPSEEEVKKKQEILERLEGPDTQLEVGLKAIDDQVEQLATGAAKALGSLWGGLAGVAKGTLTAGQSVLGKVETATLELAKELVQSVEEGVKDVNSGLKGVSELGTNLATRAERGLETMGRTAIGLLEEVAGPGQHLPRDFTDSAGNTFEQCFHSYGGRRSYEELEVLANECAQLCNRARAKLDADGKARVDKVLQGLSPLFDLLASSAPPPSTPTSPPETPATPASGEQGDAASSEVPSTPAAPATEQTTADLPTPPPTTAVPAPKGGPSKVSVESQLAAEYQPISELHAAALEGMRQLLQWAQEEAAAAAKAKEQQQQQQQGAEEGEGEGQVEGMSGEGSESAGPPKQPQHAQQQEAAAAAGGSVSATSSSAAEEGGNPSHDAPAAAAPMAAPAAAAAADEGRTSPAAADAVTSSGAAGQEGEAAAGAAKRGSKGKGPAAAAVPVDVKGAGARIVTAVRSEGMKRLAELCATEVQLLLRLGRSIAAPARYGRPADDGIMWPAGSSGKAALLQQTAQKMSADIESAAEEFLTALNSVGELVAAQLLDEKAAQSADAAGSDLEVDCGTAAARIQEGFRNLLYVVMLGSLQADGLLPH